MNPPPAVVVLEAAGADAVTQDATARVEGELRAAGFRVAVLPLDASAVRESVETSGADLSPVGAFAITAGAHPASAASAASQAVEIWVSDRIRHRTSVEQAPSNEPDPARRSAVLSVQAVELLKASLAEFWIPERALPPSPPPNPPPPPVLAPARATGAAPAPAEKTAASAVRRPFGAGPGLAVGAALVDGFRSPFAIWFPEVSVAYGWDDGFSVHVGWDGLGPASTLTAAIGTARVEEHLITCGVTRAWWTRAAVVPFLSVAAGAEHVHVTGSGTPPNQGVTSDVWSLFGSAGAGLGVPIVSGLAIVAEARAAWAWPPTIVRIGSSEVGDFGDPALMASASVLGAIP
jgi:hypothetical protein